MRIGKMKQGVASKTNNFLKRLRNGALAASLLAIQVASPVVTGLVLANGAVAHAAPICNVDTAGANDEPGQKDLTKMCADYAGQPTSVSTTWNWDELGTSGANTMDGCNLFDTDNDGNVNYSVCVTTENDPAVLKTITTYSCGDDKSDRCTSPVAPIANNASCTVTQTTNDPFASGTSAPKDTQGACTIQLSSIGGATAKLIDVCSYPSAQPNSDPSDCVVAQPKSGKLEVVKHLSPTDDSGLFNLKIDGTTKAANVTNGGTTGEVIVDDGNHTVSETAGTNTSLGDYSTTVVCKNLNGTGTIVAQGSNTSLTVPVADGSDTVCVITNTSTKVDNPTLPQACGLDIAIVIDRSSSIDDTELDQMKDAMTGFTNALSGTPTQFSVTSFGTAANVLQSFTGNTAAVNSAINGIPSTPLSPSPQYTNWEDGLIKAGSTLPNRSNPNLVLFASDGDPTISSAGPFDNNQPNAHLAPAVTQANAIKSGGSRILALGIGFSTTTRLEAISGHNVNTGDVLTSDVITTNFNELAGELAEFAKQTCGGTITTKKVIDQDGNLQTTNDQTVASGWEFDINGSPSNPAATSTNAQGLTPAVKVDAGTYSVNETQQAGYTLLSANCTGASANGSKNGNAVTGINVADNDIVSCTFINTPARGQVQVQKKLDADGNGTYEGGNSEAQAKNMFWNLDGGSNTSFGGTISSVLAGSHQVSENSVAGYHFTGWYQTGDEQHSCANPAGTTLPINITVNTGLTTGITLCNARDTGTIKVIKKVINDNGGWAKASDFDIHVKTGGSDVTGSPAAGSTTGTTYTLPTGSYTVSEDEELGYSQTSLSCVNDDQQPVANPVVLTTGQHIVCTIINDDKAPSITINKNVVNPWGTPLGVASFPLFVNGTQVTSGTTYTSFDAGSYVVTETQQAGYELTGISGDCFEEHSQINLSVDLGANVTCTLTNTAIQPKIVVIKKVINDNSGTKTASDFTMTVTGNSASVPNFPGSAIGTTVGLNEGNYVVGETSHTGYTQTFAGDCNSTISIGQTKTCTVINDDVAHPSISVVKYGPATAHEGDHVTYSFLVTNTGDTKLDGIVLNDDIATGEWCPASDLGPGESMTGYATYTIPTLQVADVTNHVQVCANDPDETEVCGHDEHTLDVLHNSIHVVKTGPATATAGSKVTYTFTVTNTGDEAVSELTVIDNIAGNGVYKSGDVNFNNRLDLTETWVYTADYTIPADQSTAVVNTVKVCGYGYSPQEQQVPRLMVDGLDNIILPPAQRTPVCDDDSHTTNITVVLGETTPNKPAVLGVTGQEALNSLAIVVALLSTSLAAGLTLASRKR